MYSTYQLKRYVKLGNTSYFYCALIMKKTMMRAGNWFSTLKVFCAFICSINLKKSTHALTPSRLTMLLLLLFSICGKVSTLLLESVPAAKDGFGCMKCPRGGEGNLAGWPCIGDLVTGWNEWGGSCSGGRTSILLTGMPLVTVEIAVFFSEISSRKWRTSFSRRIRR